MNKKAFTLIELLAVIVILGVILMIAIPKVSQYINRSKKDSFVDEARLYIDAVRNDLTNEDYPAPANANDALIVTIDRIKMEKSHKKSPFGGKYLYNKSYVAVINVGTGSDPAYAYYFAGQDTKGYAIPLTSEDEIQDKKGKVVIANAKNKMEVTIQSICGTMDGVNAIYTNLSGLDKIGSNWNATVFSTDKCGKNDDE